MTFWTTLISYGTSMWNEFVRHVKHEEKKGTSGVWHTLTTYLITIPVGLVLTFVSIGVLLAAFLLMVPIGNMFGYNLANLFAKKQANLQAKLKPGMMVPAISKFHSACQKWVSHQPAVDVFKDIASAVKKQEHDRKETDNKWEIVQADYKNMVMKVYCWSKFKWLDVMDIKVEIGEDMGGATVLVSSYSTGAAPLILPPIFGVLFSLAFFWVPFSDFGMNKKRLDSVRGMLHTDVHQDVNIVTGKGLKKDKAG